MLTCSGRGQPSLSEIETTPRQYVRLKGSTFSLRVIAAGILLLFAYYAQGVVITLVLSILLAYCLDPLVELLERSRIPRTIGAMVTVLLLCAALLAVGYAMWMRTADFADNWPKYEQVLKKAAMAVEGRISSIEGQVSEISAQPGATAPRSSGDTGWVHSMILRSIGSLYALVLEVTFVPFLVFFMLAEKREVWHGTLKLFPASRRTQVKETLDDLRDVLRDYLA